MNDLKIKIENLISLYKQKKYQEVEAISKKLLKENTKLGILYNILGLAQVDQHKLDDAIITFKQGIKIEPNFVLLYNNLGNLYKSQNKLEKAEKFYRECIAKDKSIAEVYNNLANLLRGQNKNEEAINNYKKSLELSDTQFYSHYNLGITYISLGNFIDAQKSLEKANKLNPYFGESHRSLSRIKNYKINDNHLIEMKNIYQSNKINEAQKAHLAFALGKALEDIKDYKSSFFYYKEGNKLYRKTFEYSGNKEIQKFDDIKKKYNTELFQKNKDSGHKDKSAIFILGMPRSGTTLVEQIISSHPSVYGGDELNFIPNLVNENSNIKNLKKEELTNIGKKYIDKIKLISNNSDFITDKLPINFMSIGFIKLILPNSKIIHIKRSPQDNCFSIYKNYFASSKLSFAYDLSEIINYYKLYQNLMKYWESLFPQEIIEINYEELVNNPEESIKSLIKSCDLNWDEQCLNFHNNKRPIKTASDVQARKKIYKSSLDISKKYSSDLRYIFNDLES
jgi:tetratricopeptide (TPR) repeat protein